MVETNPLINIGIATRIATAHFALRLIIGSKMLISNSIAPITKITMYISKFVNQERNGVMNMPIMVATNEKNIPRIISTVFIINLFVKGMELAVSQPQVSN